jgi:hypothetical protein
MRTKAKDVMYREAHASTPPLFTRETTNIYSASSRVSALSQSRVFCCQVWESAADAVHVMPMWCPCCPVGARWRGGAAGGVEVLQEAWKHVAGVLSKCRSCLAWRCAAGAAVQVQELSGVEVCCRCCCPSAGAVWRGGRCCRCCCPSAGAATGSCPAAAVCCPEVTGCCRSCSRPWEELLSSMEEAAHDALLSLVLLPWRGLLS